MILLESHGVAATLYISFDSRINVKLDLHKVTANSRRNSLLRKAD